MRSAFGVEHPEDISKKKMPRKDQHNLASMASSAGAYGSTMYGLKQADDYQYQKPTHDRIKQVHDKVEHARAHAGGELKEMHVDAARDWHDKLGSSNLKTHIRDIKAGEAKLHAANKLHATTAPVYAKSAKMMRATKVKGIGAGVMAVGLAGNAIHQGLKANKAGLRAKKKRR